MARAPGQVAFQMPRFNNAATALAVASIVSSVVWAIAANNGLSLYLSTVEVLEGGMWWQPFTWLLASRGTGPVLFTALIIWSTGGELEARWGSRRFLAFVLGTTFAAGLLTVAFFAVVPMALVLVAYYGGEVVFSSIWVARGIVDWRRVMNFWGFSITGRTFAMIGVLIAALNAVFGSLWLLIPEVFGLGITFAVGFGFGPGSLWLRFTSWRLQQDLKRRASHLKVVGGESRNMPTNSDKYLH